MEGGYSFEHIVSELKDMFCIIDLDGSLKLINPAGLGLLKRGLEEIIGKPWDSMFEVNSRPLSPEIIAQTVDLGIWGGEILFERANGEIFPVYLTTSLIPDPSGAGNVIAAHAADITLKKRFEEEARKRSELINKIIINAPVGIVAFDQDGKFQIANNAFLRMIGAEKPSLVLQRTPDNILPAINPKLTELIRVALGGKIVTEVNFLIGMDLEQRMTVNINLLPLEGLDGSIDGVLALFEDRTEKFKMEEKLLQTDKLASLGYLAAGVAHEISNPLTGMYTIIEGFRDDAHKKGDSEEPFERILSGIDRIKGIISKLLAFASPSAQAPQVTQVNDLIINSVDFFKHQPVYRRIRINTNLDNIPGTFLAPNDITQVLHNLFINAAQAMPAGGELTISTSLDGGINGDFIKIVFEDTGCGIPKDKLNKIFDPFFTTKPPGTGTGLGLSVSYGIIHDHGGTIEAESEEGKGARFIIRLPVKKVGKVFDEG